MRGSEKPEQAGFVPSNIHDLLAKIPDRWPEVSGNMLVCHKIGALALRRSHRGDSFSGRQFRDFGGPEGADGFVACLIPLRSPPFPSEILGEDADLLDCED